jgi:hypothetical protein
VSQSPPAGVAGDPQGAASTPPSTNPPLPPPSSGGGPAWFTVTIDVGPLPVPSASGVLTHPGLAVGTKIMALLSTIYPLSKDPDEWEMGDLAARLIVLTPGQISYMLTGRDGYLSGEYNINYIISG